ETLHAAGDEPGEVLRDSLAREVLLQHRVPPRLERDDADIGGVTLVAGSRVRHVEQTHFHESTSTFVRTTCLSPSAGQYATISSTLGRPPANPVTVGGPFNTSGTISRVKRSTAALSSPRTPIRNWTSGGSCASPARRPCVAEAPRNSVRIESNLRPRRS